MRLEDAPPAGWYPDPEGGSRLRYWEGTDWSDRFRAPPTSGVVKFQADAAEHARHEFDRVGGHVPMGGLSRQDSDEIISQVRMAARAEAERAATLFGQQARSATRDLQPLITQYTSKITRWFRIASVLAILAVAAWLVWQIFVQVSLFEWIGDRIDNFTDDDAELQPIQGYLYPF